MKIGDLQEGDFAITNAGLAVLALSPRSFRPQMDGDANVVRLANGIGAFTKTTSCTKVTKAEAYATAILYV